MQNAIRLTVLLAAFAAVLPPAASASFPGRNGKLAVSLNSCLRNTPERGSHDVRQIRAYSTGGRDLGSLTACGTRSFGPDWTADGSRLGFTLAPRDSRRRFFSIAAGGGDMRPTGVEAGPSPLSFAPGGKRVVFERDDELWIANVDGTGERKLLGRSCSNDCIEFRSPRWSPNGRRIAFEVFAYRPAEGVTTGIWILNVRGARNLRRVSRNGHEVDWSPNGKRLVFRSKYSLAHRTGRVSGGNLIVVRAGGKGRRRLVHTKTTAAVSPAWAPNGRSIAFVDVKFGGGSMAREYKVRLRRVPARGGRPRTLARLPFFADTDFEYSDPEIAWRPLPR